MPVELNRPHATFIHRDTRLLSVIPHPAVIRSIDIADLCPEFTSGLVRLDYGYGGDRRLYVEIALYKPREGTHWSHHCFNVQEAIDGQHDDAIARVAERLRIPKKELVEHIAQYAPRSN